MAKTEPFEKHVDRYEQWFLDNPLAYLSEIQDVEPVREGYGEGSFVAIRGTLAEEKQP